VLYGAFIYTLSKGEIMAFVNEYMKQEGNIVKEKIPCKIIERYNLSELMFVWKQDKKRYPHDYNPPRAFLEGEWIYPKNRWYRNISNENWLYEITSSSKYLFCYEEVLYEINLKKENEGVLRKGGEVKEYFYLESITKLLPKEKWNKENITPITLSNKCWYHFKIKGGIPYSNEEPSKNISKYFKDFLYAIRMIDKNQTMVLARNVKDFKIDMILEMNW
jgi:hypothetical protein